LHRLRGSAHCGRQEDVVSLGVIDHVDRPLFITFMADLADIAAQYNLTLHAFADDNQLYIHCKPENVQSAVTSVQQCVTAIEQWMAASRLRLNMDKTELIWTGTKHNL